MTSTSLGFSSGMAAAWSTTLRSTRVQVAPAVAWSDCWARSARLIRRWVARSQNLAKLVEGQPGAPGTSEVGLQEVRCRGIVGAPALRADLRVAGWVEEDVRQLLFGEQPRGCPITERGE